MNRKLITGALGQLGIEFIKYFEKLNLFVLATDIRNCKKDISYEFVQCDVLEKNKYFCSKFNVHKIHFYEKCL